MCRYSAYYVKTKNNGADTTIIFVIFDHDLCEKLSLINESKDKTWFIGIPTFYFVRASPTFFEL